MSTSEQEPQDITEIAPPDTWQPDTPPDTLQVGIEQFNRGDYYECHDTLEAIWMEAATAEKPFYQGILQIAVGLYHLKNHNWRGAAILLGEGSSRLLPFEPTYERVDVTDLVDQATDWLTVLQQTGPEQVATVAAQLSASTASDRRVPQVKWVPPE